MSKLANVYKAEPAIVNAVMALAVAIAAKYGFDIDANWIIMAVFGGTTAAATLATRDVVYAPDTVEQIAAKRSSAPLPRVAPIAPAPEAAPAPAAPSTTETPKPSSLPFGPYRSA